MTKLRRLEDGKIMFYCRGCEECHYFDSRWTFNNDHEKPTFSPSLLIRGVQPITNEEHELIMNGVYVEPKPLVCHSFVTDGKMQYLSDCTHLLAGETVELLNEDNWFDN